MGFSQNSVMAEVDKLVQGGVRFDKSTGTIDTTSSHKQLLDSAAALFVLHPDAVFSLSALVANRLMTAVNTEVSKVDNLLEALPHTGRSYDIEPSSSDVNNAITALSSLDATESVKGRPELLRFSKYMRRLALDVSPLVTNGNELVLSGSEAKSLISSQFLLLVQDHQRTLQLLNLFSELLSAYGSLDLQSKMASTVFKNTSNALKEVRDILQGSKIEVERKAKAVLLRALVSESVVSQTASAVSPSLLKYRGPVQPVPSDTNRYLTLAPSVTPPSVVTSIGGWSAPLSSDIQLSINGGSSQTIGITDIDTAVLYGRVSGPFLVSDSDKFLYVDVDPNIYEGPMSECTSSSVTVGVSDTTRLGYKHLGSPILFPQLKPASADVVISDTYHRVISGFGTVAIAEAFGFNPTTRQLSVSSWGAGRTFSSRDVGYSLRFVLRTLPGPDVLCEVESVVNSSTVVLRNPPLVFPTDVEYSGNLQGCDGLRGENKIIFSPELDSAELPTDGLPAVIGPAVKSAYLTADVEYTPEELCAALMTSNAGPDPMCALGLHVQVSPSALDSTKIQLRSLSSLEPRLTVVPTYLRPIVDPLRAEVCGASAHSALGFLQSESDRGSYVSPSELADRLNKDLAGAVAAVQEDTILSGEAKSDYGSGVLEDAQTDFSSVEVGSSIEILSGTSAGLYQVLWVSSYSITVDTTFKVSERVRYRIFTQRVSITAESEEAGSSITLESSPAELGLVPGVTLGEGSSVSIVEASGAVVTMSDILPGDILVTDYGSRFVESVGEVITLDSPLPSTLVHGQFEVRNGQYQKYVDGKAVVDSVLSGKTGFPKYGFDSSLAVIDAAISPVVSSGFGMRAAPGRVSSLLSFLKSNLQTVLSALSGYTCQRTVALDSFIDGLIERGSDRAADLLRNGDLQSFFTTNEETASYAGSVSSASKAVIADLPDSPTMYRDMRTVMSGPIEYHEFENPEEVFESEE